MNLSDMDGTDNAAANFDNSFSIGDIMQQQSNTGLDTEQGTTNATSVSSSNMSHAVEQTSRHLVGVILPKTAPV
jgi:hypothetical protein